jgi:hypothetical protein
MPEKEKGSDPFSEKEKGSDPISPFPDFLNFGPQITVCFLSLIFLRIKLAHIIRSNRIQQQGTANAFTQNR